MVKPVTELDAIMGEIVLELLRLGDTVVWYREKVYSARFGTGEMDFQVDLYGSRLTSTINLWCWDYRYGNYILDTTTGKCYTGRVR